MPLTLPPRNRWQRGTPPDTLPAVMMARAGAFVGLSDLGDVALRRHRVRSPAASAIPLLQAGDGASFAAPDVGQMGNNPCNDPPEYPGAFRTQNPNRINGKILRMDPATLEWEIYASGVRNPFRLAWYNDMLLQSDTGWYT